jgi:squalene synthase HpnC
LLNLLARLAQTRCAIAGKVRGTRFARGEHEVKDVPQPPSAIARITLTTAVREPPVAGWDLDRCYATCAAIARRGSENFPVVNAALPAELAPHVAAVYAFARIADDIVDEPAFEGRRAAELDAWEERLHRCLHGEADHPVFAALAATIVRHDLPFAPFADILAALRMDLGQRRYISFGELMAYVERAAVPVGRLLMAVLGVRDAHRTRFADDLATAIALTNFWQNLATDVGRGRLYVPLEDLVHFGVREADLRARRQTVELAWLVRFQCARTRAFYERAAPLIALVDAHAQAEIDVIWSGGRRALDEVDARAGQVFAGG